MNPYRLPEHVIPTRYELRLEPDLSAGTFSGVETVIVSVKEPTSQVVLNAAELEITSAAVTDKEGLTHQGMIALDESLERCRFTFPHSLSLGTWHLRVTFKGLLNDKLRGFYRSTYKDREGNTCLLAATQFEATDARRAFPCWDEPAFKAVFSTVLAIAPDLSAVSNTAIASERFENGKRVIRFKDTIRMSTYLVAFIVGNIEGTEPTMIGSSPLRVWSVPGKQHLARFGQEIGEFSLRFFEGYYGLPYPGDKLDLLAIPDFASGAMENLGAITFRETAILIDEQGATHAELERVADVVAHENAHMWFGDLVTMSWWNGLWLNEAFATFMEMLAVDAWKPEWDRWTTFGVSRAAALLVDGLHSTRPIEYEVHAPRDADAMFDVLTYEKGASVLRMLEQHVGPEVFREGVRHYLRAHAYANAQTQDFWTALGGIANQPVPALMERWIFGQGYPLITVSLDEANRLIVEQQRFTYLAAPPGPADLDEPCWHVPLHIRFLSKQRAVSHRTLLTGVGTRLDLPPGCETALVNEKGHGFYRVRYSPELLERLLDVGLHHLEPIERFNLINDAWASTVAGLSSLSDYLDLTARFRQERNKNVWAILIESFQRLNRMIQPADRPGLEGFVRDRLRPAAEELGWFARSDDSELDKQLRGDLLQALGTIGNDEGIQASAHEVYLAYRESSERVDPNVLTALLSILAHVGGPARYTEFFQRFRSATTPQEERRYLFALAAFQAPDILEQTLTCTINGKVRTQDAPFVVGSVLTNVSGRVLAWEFVKEKWETMDSQFPKQGLRRMCSGITALATPTLEQDVQHFFESRKIDLGGKILAQYLEQLRIAVTFRERDGAALSQYLAAFASP